MNKIRKSAETSALHDLHGRFGAGVLVVSTPIRRFLLAKRGMDGASPGTWAPFGGMVEPGEQLIRAALRELWEECGIRLGMNDPGLLSTPLYVDQHHASNFEFHTFVAVIDYVPEVTINEESLGYGWFNLDDKPEDLHPGAAKMFASADVIQPLKMLGGYAPARASLLRAKT